MYILIRIKYMQKFPDYYNKLILKKYGIFIKNIEINLN